LSSITTTATLSLHDALPIFVVKLACIDGLQSEERLADVLLLAGSQHEANVRGRPGLCDPPDRFRGKPPACPPLLGKVDPGDPARSEEHTSEPQSRENLVCRL